MLVGVSGRVVDKDVGGNTRYARAIHESNDKFFDSRILRSPLGFKGKSRSVDYLLRESLVWPERTDLDVLHYPADTGPLRRARLPVVTTVHGVASLHVAGVRKTAQERIWRTRVGNAIHLSDLIVTVSENSARDLVQLFSAPTQKIRVIHHGIDPKFNPDNVLGHQLCGQLEALNLPEKYVLYLGNLDPRKNVGELARAADDFACRTGARLVVAGAPAWGSDPTIRAMRDSANVHYIGRVPEPLVVPILQNASLFCFPSKYEGFGFPVLEAMACGTPVLCSDRGSLREVTAGAAQLLQDISATGISNAVTALLKDDHRLTELSTLGIQQAERFTWTAARLAHRAVFEEASNS